MAKYLSIFLILVCLAACAPMPPALPTAALTHTEQVTSTLPVQHPSDWAGSISHADGSSESITVSFTGTSGTIIIEPFIKTYPISELEWSGTGISFNILMGVELHFSGEFDGSQITGRAQGDGRADSFILLPLYSVSSHALDDYLGTYQFPSGSALLINLAPQYSSSGLYFFGQGLIVTHFGTGAIRALYPLDLDTFLVGNARAVGYPFAGKITFTRDSNGKMLGLIWDTYDQSTGTVIDSEQAHLLGLHSELVHFTAKDGIDLVGLLTLPATEGPYPAVMMLHGSEQGTRDDFGDQQMSAFMASRGIAILTYDKRSVGDSGGQYSESASEINLDLTARDAIAGLEYLANRTDINMQEIGLIGFSQAGWVIPLAASSSGLVSWFIVLSGPITSVGHENLFSSFTQNGDSTAVLSQEEIMGRLAAAPHSGYDSTPVIATLDLPAIWIFGDQDKSIPVAESVENLTAILANGKTNFSFMVLPQADHNLQQTIRGLFNEIPYAPGYQVDYYSSMSQWLDGHVK